MASTFFGVNAGTVPPGSPVEIGVFVNSEGETVNAVSGDVIIPLGAGDVNIINGGSLISLWLQPPVISGDRIHFEGIIPGGLTSSQLPLFSVILTPSAAGELALGTENVHVYKNDGLGTSLPVRDGRLTLLVKEGAAAPTTPAVDITPPEVFSVAVIHDPSIADGRPAIIFATTDTESGLDYFEVRENSGPLSSDWVAVTSPYVLHTSYWPMSSVEVRAVDRAGNVRTASVGRSADILPLLLIGGCILITVMIAISVALSVRRRLWRKQKNSRRR